jgi:hypothetical protein
VTFIYGLPALEVIDPDGEVVLYLVRQVIPERHERRAYVLTKPDGSENRCAETANLWQCTCRSFVYRDRFDVAKQGRCKHLTAIGEWLEPAEVSTPVEAA